VGSTQQAWEETSAAVAPAYAELEQALATQPVLNVDETGHRTSGAKRWLWTLVAPTFVCYRIATSRGTDVLHQLLGASFPGILCSDRLPTYLKYPVDRRQLCWAHIIRALKSAHELAHTTAGRRFCLHALALTHQLFRLWHRFRGDPDARGAPLTREQLFDKAEQIAKKLHALADQHVHAADKHVRNLACALVHHHQHFFTFIHEEGVEPTNNRAERALRTAVIWRKITFGTRSDEGERAVERLLTVVRTCQLQQISALVYVTAAIRAHRRHEVIASLLRKRTNP
jgi:transposase